MFLPFYIIYLLYSAKLHYLLEFIPFFISCICFIPSSLKWTLSFIKKATFLKSLKFLFLIPWRGCASKKGSIFSVISENFSTIKSPQVEFEREKYLPQPKVAIIFFKSSSSRLCWVNINLSHIALPNLDLGEFLMVTKKQPSASVKPANQFKSYICLFLTSSLITSCSTVSSHLKAIFNLLDKPPLFNIFFIDKTLLRPSLVKC